MKNKLTESENFFKNKCKEVAFKNGWKSGEEEIENNKTVCLWFTKGSVTLMIAPIERMVVTHMKHPRRRDTSILKREGLALSEIELILKNPRAHTSKGKQLHVCRKRN